MRMEDVCLCTPTQLTYNNDITSIQYIIQPTKFLVNIAEQEFLNIQRYTAVLYGGILGFQINTAVLYMRTVYQWNNAMPN